MRKQHVRTAGALKERLRGFSLIEVMVALIVLSVGLLGVARMQSLALSSTSVASQRSMAAIEAESLAAAMHENRGYWTNSDPALATIKLQGTTISVTSGAPLLSAAGTPNCKSTTTPCTPTQMAAFDLQQWATDLNGVLPGTQATITCGNVTPVSCLINIVWAETVGAANAQQATVQQAVQAASQTSSVQNSSYTLYVQP